MFCPAAAAEALQAIRTLRSDKAPLVKKRQLMRTMFGDYRKKMEEEWCRELKLMEAGRRTFYGGGREEKALFLLCIALQSGISLYEMTKYLLLLFPPLFKL